MTSATATATSKFTSVANAKRTKFAAGTTTLTAVFASAAAQKAAQKAAATTKFQTQSAFTKAA